MSLKSPSICLDANVFVAASSPLEKTHETSLLLIKYLMKMGIDLYEPDVFMFETCHALHRKFILKEITESQFEQVMSYFYSLPVLIQWQEHMLIQVAKIARSLSLPGVADSAYIATAQARRAYLITWDEDLIRRGRKVYKKILTPQKFLDSVS